MLELELVDRVDVVSTVSGGSLFGGAWMAARADGRSDAEFLQRMRAELECGFVARTIRPRLLWALTPLTPYSLTDALAATFDRIFFTGRGLETLPERPRLCINTTVMNNGALGKFSRQGFSAWGLRLPGQSPEHHIPMGDFPLALAVAASAAFPVGLPPVELTARRFPAGLEFGPSLRGTRRISLTDGGVLENLGIQTLISSRRFGTWDMIVSDAGTAEAPWRPRAPLNGLRSFGLWLLSGRTLDRIMLIMNNKQNRWARQQVVEELRASWLHHTLEHGSSRPYPGLRLVLAEDERLARRNVLFARVDQSWASFMYSIPAYRVVELALARNLVGADAETPALVELLTHAGYDTSQRDARVRDIEALQRFFERAEVDLSRARSEYARLGGDPGASAMNEITTNFTKLSATVLDQLEAHAAWQIHAAHEIYGL